MTFKALEFTETVNYAQPLYSERQANENPVMSHSTWEM